MWPYMSAGGLAAIINSARFPIWRTASIEPAPRVRDVVTINNHVRSVLLELSEPRLLVQPRFRMRADDEPDAFEQFATEALDYWANSIQKDPQDRASATRVKIANLSWQLRPVGYGVVGGSATLEQVGHPSAAVDVALGSSWFDLELVEFADPGPAN